MRGQTTLIGSLAFLFIAAITASATEIWQFDGGARSEIVIVTGSEFTRTRLQVAQGATGARIGGSCTYRDVPGTATIIRVAKTPASIQQARTAGGPGYEGFEVSFKFTPSQPIAEPQVRNFTQSTHLLRLTNSWYPGPRYIEKYHLSQDVKVPALLKVRTSGACTPMLFSFPGIEKADYFERAQ